MTKRLTVFMFVVVLIALPSLCSAQVSLSFTAPDLSVTQYSPIHFAVKATSSHPITGWHIYVDGTSVYSAGAVTSINAYVAMSAGTHSAVVRAWDSTGAYGSRTLSITVTNSPTPTPTPTSGLNYYVNPAGSDSYDGSLAHPWRTIQHAANSVKPGATVHVAPGLYQEAIVSNISGTATARIRYISDTKWDARIVSSGAFATWQNNGSYVDIVGFDVTGTGNHQGIWHTGSYGKILGNQVHNIAVPCDSNGGAGINSGSYTASNNVIDGNIVHDMGVWGTLCNGVHAIYISQPGDVVSNNIVYRSTGAAINMYHDAGTNAIIVNNTVFNSGAQGPNGSCYGAGIAIGGATNNYTVVANNIVRDIHCWAIIELDGDNGPNNRFMNNLLYNNYLPIHANTGTVSGTITADPQFMNYVSTGGGDYTVAATSPAIDRGTSTGAPKTDILGGARPTGAGYDIGAFEFNSSPATWPWF